MEDIIAIIMIFGIPLSAVIGFFILKYKKLSMSEISSEDKQRLLQVLQENEELRSRLNNVEAIVSEVDLDLLKIEAHTKSDLERELDKMKQKDKVKKS